MGRSDRGLFLFLLKNHLQEEHKDDEDPVVVDQQEDEEMKE